MHLRSKSGLASRCRVCAIPPETKKVDNRNGTIEKGPVWKVNTFQADLKSLKAASNAEPISLDDLSKSHTHSITNFRSKGFFQLPLRNH